MNALETTNPQAAPAPAAPLTAICSEKGCEKPADFRYRWPWDKEDRFCCATHRMLVEQLAPQLGRAVPAFIQVEPNRPKPITRDERTQLIAARLSAEEELIDVKARGAELYKQASELAGEVSRLRARNASVESQLSDAAAAVRQAAVERDNALAALQEAQQEIERLRTLEKMLPAKTEGKSRKDGE